MRINLPLVCSILCLAFATHAQDTEDLPLRRQVRYHNQFSTGILAGGEYGLVTGSVSTVHGVAAGKWTIGAGIGMEGYERWRTVPVFGALSYYFRGPANNGMFLSFNAGHGFGRLLKTQEVIEPGETKGGPMINAMVGYQISTSKFSVNIAAGYKQQRMQGNYQMTFNNAVTYSIKETMDRFMLQLGFSVR